MFVLCWVIVKVQYLCYEPIRDLTCFKTGCPFWNGPTRFVTGWPALQPLNLYSTRFVTGQQEWTRFETDWLQPTRFETGQSSDQPALKQDSNNQPTSIRWPILFSKQTSTDNEMKGLSSYTSNHLHISNNIMQWQSTYQLQTEIILV